MLSGYVITQAIVSGVLIGAVYGLIAVGFTLVFGVMKVVNFGHGHLVMASMFAAYVLFNAAGIDPFVSTLILVPAAFVVGLLLYETVIRRIIPIPDTAQMMVTLGLFIFLENLANLIFGGDLRGANTSYTTSSLMLGPVAISVPRAAAALVSVAASACLYLFLQRTDFGTAIRAAANNRVGALLSGIPVTRVFRFAFASSVAAAALAGAVMVSFFPVSPFLGGDLLMRAFAIVVLGGMGSVPGALVGGLMVGLIESLSTIFISASLANAITFGALILVLLIKPSGLFGLAEG